MKNFLFDIKLLASVRVEAPDEVTARRILEAWFSSVTIFSGVHMTGGSRVHPCEGSMDGEADLMEVDGEAV